MPELSVFNLDYGKKKRSIQEVYKDTDMQEIRFHGRGGQGTVIASVIMAKALFSAGFYVQTFPLFGSERRGAPVTAYLRMDEKKIRVRTHVYNPDHVIILDERLTDIVDVTSGLSHNGTVTINASDAAGSNGYFWDGMKKKFNGRKVCAVDASALAAAHKLGTVSQPIVNTAMTGAFARIAGIPPLKDIITAIREEAPVNKDANVDAAKAAYEAAVIME